MNEPIYQHDCVVCRFVGIDQRRFGDRRGANQVDMWVHIDHRGYYSLIRRYSSEPADYGCIDYQRGRWMPPRYRRVYDAWKKQIR